MVVFSYAAVYRLFGIAGVYWREIDGESAGKGFDPLELPLNRFLNFIYYWLKSHVDPEKWESVEAEIFAPFTVGDPDAVPTEVAEEEMSLFNRFTRENKALGG